MQVKLDLGFDWELSEHNTLQVHDSKDLQPLRSPSCSGTRKCMECVCDPLDIPETQLRSSYGVQLIDIKLTY